MITDYFSIEEVACPHVYKKYGEFAWNFFDIRLLMTEEVIRKTMGEFIQINDYAIHGDLTQRGLRCVLCDLMKQVYKSGKLFMDPHALGKAWDQTVIGITAEEARQWIINNQKILPYPIRLEDKVDWVHIDTYNDGLNGKVILFNT